VTLTLGIEEEFLLLDGRGMPAARSAEVLEVARRLPAGRDADLQHELLEVQVEVATGICPDLAEAERQLTALREAVAKAAATSGCRLAAVAAAPLVDDAEETPVVDAPRYQALREQAPALVEEQLINGMHVHVGIPDRTDALKVLAGIRPWLPVLLALSANSPVWRGRDSGFASFRSVHFARWPVEGAPPVFASVDEYDARAEALLATGAIRDRGQLYWHVRLSHHEPTVETRVADVQLDAATATALAGLVRGLAATALAAPAVPVAEQVPAEVLRAATWTAARRGLDDGLVDPRSGTGAPAAVVVRGLLEHVADALDGLGERELVEARVERLLAGGTGAARQRRALREGGLPAVMALATGSAV
jgi:glutamate---cysteine ligase / carboxylate-amine ligase